MPASIKPVETRRLYQHVADQLRGLMASGAFPAGSRMPPERDLALQLGVSRPSLREALIALEIDGRIEIRMGSGVYVCAQPLPSGQGTSALGESPTELMQARATVESSVAMLAAARVTQDSLARIGESLAAMRRAHAVGRMPLDEDRRFHVGIAEACGNSVLVRLVGELFDERHSPISRRLSDRAESETTWSDALAEHESIYLALQSRDPQGAAAAMSTHLLMSLDRWVKRTLSQTVS